MYTSITINSSTVSFRLWQPADGQVFDSAFAFDLQTTAIDYERPWFAPAYVIGAATDGEQGYIIERQHGERFAKAHHDVPWVFFNAPFRLAVLHAAARQAGIYDLVEQDRVWDAQLLHRLYLLASEGTDGEDQCSLSECALRHLQVEMPKEPLDRTGQKLRLAFDRFIHKPVEAIPSALREYLARNVLITILLYKRLSKHIRVAVKAGEDAFGHVSEEWLRDAIKKWGPQTHHIQLKAAIVLREISNAGLHIDVDRAADLRKGLGTFTEELKSRLKQSYGYQHGQKGSVKALDEIMRRIDDTTPDFTFPRTKTGKYETKRETLAPLAGRHEFIRDFLALKQVELLSNTFLTRLDRRIVHPNFNPLVRSGRTSSSGKINAQNLPRDDRVRSCFIPPPGCVFIDADYRAIEMATLAQSVKSQFDLRSKLAQSLNRGEDPHRLVAAKMTGKEPSEVTDEERRQAKAINFGKPGGMGDPALKAYAKATYNVELSDAEVAGFVKTWFKLFPEMKSFLESNHKLGEAVATFFGLTPAAHCEHTRDRRFIDHQANEGAEDQPHSFLGLMFLKALAMPRPQQRNGEPYSGADIAFFWAMAKQYANGLPKHIREWILGRKASWRLRNDLTKVFDRFGVFTLTGRLRANASFGARRNTVFQGLAADGAKLALWRLWRKGYMIHNFIHDEVLISVPATDDVAMHEKTIRTIMVKAMREVVPDIKISVESRVMSNWSKSEATTKLSPCRKGKGLITSSARKKTRIVLRGRR